MTTVATSAQTVRTLRNDHEMVRHHGVLVELHPRRTHKHENTAQSTPRARAAEQHNERQCMVQREIEKSKATSAVNPPSSRTRAATAKHDVLTKITYSFPSASSRTSPRSKFGLYGGANGSCRFFSCCSALGASALKSGVGRRGLFCSAGHRRIWN